MFQRTLHLAELAQKKSVLLLGPRMTGKSTLLRSTFPDAQYLDLLEPQTFRELSVRPESLEERVRTVRADSRSRIVIVDEVQKLPELLDVAQRIIELFPHIRLVLTGSSARKLKRTGVNLLGGRLRRVDLFPLTSKELPEGDYKRLISWGGLPSVLASKDPINELKDYVGLYLREEIQSEGLTRSIGGFARFLETAALTNAEQVMFSSVANDAQLPVRTVRDHFQVLEDTLVGTLLPAYRATKTRKAMAAAKFYFFDVGVANTLLERWSLKPGTPEYGKALEHLVFCELRAAMSYFRSESHLSYWRSLSKMEVDFVVEHRGKAMLALEVKSSKAVSQSDLRGLAAFSDDAPAARKIVVCEAPVKRETANRVEVWPVAEFLSALWKGNVLPG